MGCVGGSACGESKENEEHELVHVVHWCLEVVVGRF